MDFSEVKFDDNWPVFERMLGYLRYLKISNYIAMTPKPKCVDIGCGFDGRFLRSISRKIDIGYGFDLRANEATYGNIEVINNSKINGDLPLEDNFVDRVFMLAVIEHLPYDTMLVKEGVRVLKKGGLFIITTPTPFAKPILEFLSYKLHIISEESIREHKHYYTKKELVDLFNDNGLEVVKYNLFQLGCNEMIIGRKK